MQPDNIPSRDAGDFTPTTEFAMGRPPIGKEAMTGAERMRLYRLTHGTAKPVTKPVTKPAAAGPDRRDEEIARLKARVAELARAMVACQGKRIETKKAHTKPTWISLRGAIV